MCKIQDEYIDQQYIMNQLDTTHKMYDLQRSGVYYLLTENAEKSIQFTNLLLKSEGKLELNIVY